MTKRKNEENVNVEDSEVKDNAQKKKSTKKHDSEIENLKKKISELEKQNKEYLDFLRRNQAEFENFRKREIANRANTEKIAQKVLLENLLEIDDNFLHALNAEVEDLNAYKSGVELIAKQLEDFLKKFGVVKFESINNPFDPEYHEAMMRVEEGEHEGDIVTQVFREGYMLGDKVLRHARVKVSSGASIKSDEVKEETVESDVEENKEEVV